MNDITALMATMKAAAEKATPGEWSVQFGDEVYATDGVENEQIAIATNDARDADFIALANPANVLALVEALEKAQSKATQQGNIACALFDEVTSQRQRIAELEEIATDYGMKFQRAQDDLKKMALMESRTVTVKLPAINEYLAEVHDKTLALAFRRLAEGVREGDVAAMRAAGIQVIEGEGQ